MESKNQAKKSRKLVSAGVFIAILFVIFSIFGSAFMPVPILYIMMPAVIALFCGPVYMLLIAKTQMPGPLFIAAMLPGIFLLAMGHMWIVILTCAVAGVLAEVIARAGNYKKFSTNTISYVLFTQNLIGGFLPIWIMRDYFFEDMFTRGMSADFCDTLLTLTPPWMLAVMVVSIAVCAVAGAFIGKSMFKKHFVKAGVV